MNAISFQHSYVKARSTNWFVDIISYRSSKLVFKHLSRPPWHGCQYSLASALVEFTLWGQPACINRASTFEMTEKLGATKFQSGYVPRIQADGRLITDHANRFQLQRTVIRKDKMEFMGLPVLHFSQKIRFFVIPIKMKYFEIF